MAPAQPPSADWVFGRFRVVPHRRELLADGRPIRLGGRTFDLLITLISARGSVVGKDVLMDRVWPDRVVDENALQAQISALRVAFGAEHTLIRTVAGRGYQFTGEVRLLPASSDERTELDAPGPQAVPPPTNLPELASELIGRDDEVQELLSLAASYRLVTLVGTGGIGKTRLALAVARKLLPEAADSGWLVDFSPLSGPGLVPATVAAAVGAGLPAGEISARRVAQALAGRQILLVLDTCEHVVDAVAEFAEDLLRIAPHARIIATSREPLRVDGEQIYAVPPLAVPAAGDDPHRCGAVRLFAARARDGGARLSEDQDAAMATIGMICRRLDGIPLAIELAAARAAALGIKGLATHLEGRFHLLTGGRRTALPRHQTLRATLDWSHELLADPERVILRRLAVFASAFSLNAARSIVASPEISQGDVVVGVSNLASKSLVAVETGSAVVQYRLLAATRSYGLERLAEAGELQAVSRRHAEYYLDVFEQAETEWEVRQAAEWLADYRPQIDNLRAALDWAYRADGDTALGLALTVAAVPLWLQLSLVVECRNRVEQALAGLSSEGVAASTVEMKLYAALGACLLMTKGPSPETDAAWTRAFELAEAREHTGYQIRALWGLWVQRMNNGERGKAMALTQRVHSLAQRSADPADLGTADRMIGITHHYQGDQPQARFHLERMLNTHGGPVRRSSATHFLYDQTVVARAALARTLWMQGLPDQASQTAQGTVDDARDGGNPVTVCFAVAEAGCLVALFNGDMVTADRYVSVLLDRAEAHGFGIWRSWGNRFRGTLLIWRGDFEAGVRCLQASLEQHPEATFHPRFAWFIGPLAYGLARAGRIGEAFGAIDEALARCERNEDRWCLSELLRVKGELLLQQGAPEAAVKAEDQFRQALDWARRQGALSWELRAATSLAGLLHDQGGSADAEALLRPVYARFTEGFDTADLTAARALLDAIGKQLRDDAAAPSGPRPS